MSLVEQLEKAAEGNNALLLILNTAKGKKQAMADILKAAVSENGAEVIFLARINSVTAEED